MSDIKFYAHRSKHILFESKFIAKYIDIINTIYTILETDSLYVIAICMLKR